MNCDEKWKENVGGAQYLVADSLLAWIDGLGEANPEYTQESLRLLRNQLFAFFNACMQLPKWLVGELVCWRERFDHFYVLQQYLDLFAAIQASQYLLMHSEQENIVTLEIWGTEAMYSQEAGFSDEWLGCLQWRKPISNTKFDVAVSNLLSDKIAKLCGRQFNMVDGLAWRAVGFELAKMATCLPEAGDWINHTEAFFSHVRSHPAFTMTEEEEEGEEEEE